MLIYIRNKKIIEIGAKQRRTEYISGDNWVSIDWKEKVRTFGWYRRKYIYLYIYITNNI